MFDTFEPTERSSGVFLAPRATLLAELASRARKIAGRAVTTVDLTGPAPRSSHPLSPSLTALVNDAGEPARTENLAIRRETGATCVWVFPASTPAWTVGALIVLGEVERDAHRQLTSLATELALRLDAQDRENNREVLARLTARRVA
ncbi:MAG: hypothetical protein KC776_18310 [Myxococcales bacterium]|nr:hypothetical protein [Myxococcales bacterium]MCB9579304.1 hypothetical protein [Polyangiaceae bacterium]